MTKRSCTVNEDDDVRILHGMGYAQELSRRLGRFSNFAISFSIICILAGGINSLAQATSGAGGAAIGLGWPLGVLISGAFGIAMAQIASAFPTAGGLYHWGSILGNRFTGWLTAWFNLLGLVTVLGSINVGAYNFFLGAFGARLQLRDSMPLLVAFLAAITAAQALVNHYGISLTAKLTDFSGYLIFGTALLLAATCLARTPHFELARLWTFANYSGDAGANVWPRSGSGGWVFLLGLLLPIYTITGYDASAHTSEETRDAPRSVPRGIVASILWSGVFGYLFLVAFLFMIP
ncbi:MAG: amino acid permease, partial [Gammaproteobacteria bacterium]|nr:amino acid permease [Gammaproteobacteria bacterium]